MFLTVAAIIPAIVLCIYIFKKDRVDKEPISLLLTLFALGAICCFPAAKIESFIIKIIASVFSPFGQNIEGTYVLSDSMFSLYNAVKYFVGVGLVEETLKFVVMFFATRKNKNFNSLFDGIVYAVFTSLGFAALENIFYVLDYGFETAVLRGILSVPAHAFFGVIMGYYYSMYHMYGLARIREQAMRRNQIIPASGTEISEKRFLVLSLLMPTLAHGLYDFSCTQGSGLANVLFYAFIIFLYFYCFAKIKRTSKYDVPDHFYVNSILRTKYPQYIDFIGVQNQDEQL